MVTIGKGVAVVPRGVKVDTVVVAASLTRKGVLPTEIKFTNS